MVLVTVTINALREPYRLKWQLLMLLAITGLGVTIIRSVRNASSERATT